VIPHANTRYFDGLCTGEFWLAGTLALMLRCDAVLLTAKWHTSAGAIREARTALAVGLPVCKTLLDLRPWLCRGCANVLQKSEIP
jgi:hypothetical protein